MRKLAPAFVMTTFIALASGSALALGDMHKDKKAPKTDTTTPSSTYSNPSSTPTPSAPSTASTTPDSQVARNEADKCDTSKYPNKANMPKDCKDKSGTGAAATSSTQKQSGGDSASSGSAGAGSSSSSSGSSSK